MFLYLNEYGYKVSKRDEFLVVERSDGTKEEYSLNNLDSVYFGGEGRISKAIILELTKRKIDAVLLSEKGKPMIYFFPVYTKPKVWDLWKRQILLDSRKKTVLAKRFVLNAIKAKIILLSKLAKSRKRTNKELAQKLITCRNRIRGIERKVRGVEGDFNEVRKTLMGLEGFSARLYFEILQNVIPRNFGYSGLRTRRPPTDLFNAALSYGYGYLKYLVERELVFAGINPYYGILHQETDKVYPFLTFDIMEGFRHSFVDKIVIGLISRRMLNPNKHSRKFGNGVYLNKFGTNKLYALMLEERKITCKLIRGETKNFLNTIRE